MTRPNQLTDEISLSLAFNYLRAIIQKNQIAIDQEVVALYLGKVHDNQVAMEYLEDIGRLAQKALACAEAGD